MMFSRMMVAEINAKSTLMSPVFRQKKKNMGSQDGRPKLTTVTLLQRGAEVVSQTTPERSPNGCLCYEEVTLTTLGALLMPQAVLEHAN